MKALISLVVIAALGVVAPASSEAQVRVSVNVGVGGYGGYRGQGWLASYRHRGRGCHAYSRFGCHPREVVILRRPIYRHHAPVVVVRPGYRNAYRRDYGYRRHRW